MKPVLKKTLIHCGIILFFFLVAAVYMSPTFDGKVIQQGDTLKWQAMAKEQMKSSFIFGLENINSRMFNIGKNKLLLDKVYEADEVLQGYDNVTKEDILDAARLIGRASDYCGAAVTGREFDLEALVRS